MSDVGTAVVEAPAKKQSWYEKLTPEQKTEHTRKMKEGREKAKAREIPVAQAAEFTLTAPPPSSDDDRFAALEAQIKGLTALLEARTRIPATGHVPPPAPKPEKDPDLEAYYECVLDYEPVTDQETGQNSIKIERISDPKDARWDAIEKSRRDPGGQLVLCRVIRGKGGDVVGRRVVTAHGRGFRAAREHIEAFTELGRFER